MQDTSSRPSKRRRITKGATTEPSTDKKIVYPAGAYATDSNRVENMLHIPGSPHVPLDAASKMNHARFVLPPAHQQTEETIRSPIERAIIRSSLVAQSIRSPADGPGHSILKMLLPGYLSGVSIENRASQIEKTLREDDERMEILNSRLESHKHRLSIKNAQGQYTAPPRKGSPQVRATSNEIGFISNFSRNVDEPSPEGREAHKREFFARDPDLDPEVPISQFDYSVHNRMGTLDVIRMEASRARDNERREYENLGTNAIRPSIPFLSRKYIRSMMLPPLPGERLCINGTSCQTYRLKEEPKYVGRALDYPRAQFTPPPSDYCIPCLRYQYDDEIQRILRTGVHPPHAINPFKVHVRKGEYGPNDVHPDYITGQGRLPIDGKFLRFDAGHFITTRIGDTEQRYRNEKIHTRLDECNMGF